MEKVKEELPVYETGEKISEREIEEVLLRGLRKTLICG